MKCRVGNALSDEQRLGSDAETAGVRPGKTNFGGGGVGASLLPRESSDEGIAVSSPHPQRPEEMPVFDEHFNARGQ